MQGVRWAVLVWLFLASLAVAEKERDRRCENEKDEAKGCDPKANLIRVRKDGLSFEIGTEDNAIRILRKTESHFSGVVDEFVSKTDRGSLKEKEGSESWEGGWVLVWKTPSQSRSFIQAGYALWNRSAVIVNGNYNVSEDILFLSVDQTIDGVREGACEMSARDEERERERKSEEPLLCVFGSLLSSAGLHVSNYTLSFSRSEGSLLSFSLSLSPPLHSPIPLNRLFIHYSSPADEGIFGMGHQYTLFNMKGWKIPIIVSEQGVGRGIQPLTDTFNGGTVGSGGTYFTTYAPSPIYVTNYNRSVVIDNAEFAFFDFTKKDIVTLEMWGQNIRGYLILRDTLSEVIQDVTSLTGRMRPLPNWSQTGAIIGLEGGEEGVIQIVDQLRKASVPLSAVWLQDWVGMRHSPIDGDRLIWNWELNPDQYPHWHTMVASWMKEGVRVMNYVNPFFSDPTNLTSRYRRNMAAEGLENNYFVMHADGSPYEMWSLSVQFWMLDPTNPDAVAWMKQIVKDEVLSRPLSCGWMCDFGEYLPMDARLFSGVDPVSYHNYYPQAWAEIVKSAVSEAVEEGLLDADEIVFFVRAGWSRSPASAPLFWWGYISIFMLIPFLTFLHQP